MKIYKLQLAPGEERSLAIQGVFFRVLEASAEIYIGVDADVLMPMSQGIGYQAEPGQAYNQLRIYSATAQSVTIAAGLGRIDDARLNTVGPVTIAGTVSIAGIVEVIDTVALSVDAGREYMAAVNVGGGTAINYAILRNPVGALIDMLVRRFTASTNVAGSIDAYLIDEIDGTLVVGVSSGISKKYTVGSVPGSVGQTSGRHSLTVIDDAKIASGGTPANATLFYDYSDTGYIRLQPGTALAIGASPAGTTITAGFEWKEVAQ